MKTVDGKIVKDSGLKEGITIIDGKVYDTLYKPGDITDVNTEVKKATVSVEATATQVTIS